MHIVAAGLSNHQGTNLAMLIGDTLREAAARAPDQTALIDSISSITYAEFDRRANQLANALLGLRLEKGARVAILSRNRIEYAVAYFAIARTHYVSVHCSTRSATEELAYVLNKIAADVLLFESEFTHIVGPALQGLTRKLKTIRIGAGTDKNELAIDAVALPDFVAGHAYTQPDSGIDTDAPLAITLTGGTTGMPKAVLVSHNARYASAVAAAQEFGIDATDIVAASTPLFHCAGLFVWFGTAVMLGSTIVLPEDWDPVRFMQLVEQEQITAAFLVPSQLSDLVGHKNFSTAPLRTLTNIGYAGAPLGEALFARIRSALPHVAFTENYGQSEACPITVRNDECGPARYPTVGRAVAGVELEIIGKAGEQLPAGTVGEIIVHGDQVFSEYLNDPEETAAALRLGNGWLLTGDVGSLDEDGFLTLVDRSKDMLICGGENIYSAEIENALYEHDDVAECAVFGIPDERWGEVPAAHIVLTPGASVTEQDLTEFCTTKIARFKRPRVVRFVTSFPRTPVGKIRKNELRAPYWDGHIRKI